VPDEGCVEGCRRILALTHDLRPEDLVFTVVGNGVSALLTLPAEGVTLEDVRRVTYLMQIERGAPTRDLNPIRNHIDQIKGGRLARYCQPARVVNLVAYNPDAYDALMHHNVWLHSLPEGSTFAYAREMLHRWDAWDQAPAAVKAVLERADPAQETVKADEFQRMGGVIFCTMPAHLGMLQTARRKAEALGFHTLVLTTWHNTEASQLGMVHADIANSIERHGLPVEPPCALLSGGEMLVTVGQESGMGGRNQEYALAAALRISGSPDIVMGSVDSDGTDGPGRQFIQGYDHIPDLGGGIVDGQTAHVAPTLDLDLRAALKRHDTSPALWALGDAVEISKNISVTDLVVTLVMARGENPEWRR
jgi:glycerate-2-kinase